MKAIRRFVAVVACFLFLGLTRGDAQVLDFITEVPTLTAPEGLSKNPVNVTFTLPEAAKPGSLKLIFDTTTLTLASSQESSGAHSFSFDPTNPTASPEIASGSPLADGSYTVTLIYQDVFGNPPGSDDHSVTLDTTIGQLTVDSPNLTIFAGALPDYRTDVHGDGSETVVVDQQDPAPGTTASVGPLPVKVTGHDAAGNSTSLTFIVTVRSMLAVSEVMMTTGEDAPDAGLPDGPPDGAKLTGFGVPAIDDDGNIAYLGKWSASARVKGTGLFTSSGCLAVTGGEVPGIDGAFYRSFSDPVIRAGNLACIAKITGAARGSVILFGPVTGPLSVLAQTGTEAPDADGANYHGFGAVEVLGDGIGFIAKLALGTGSPKVTAATDTGLWMVDGILPLSVMLREGPQLNGPAIKTITAFKPGNGSPGQGRGWVRQPNEGVMLAQVTYVDKTQAVLEAGSLGIRSLSDKQTDNGASFSSFGIPAANNLYHTAFLGTLALGGNITKANARGIFVDYDDTTFTTVAQGGTPAGATGATFSLLKDPVLSEDGGVAFAATLSGTSAKGFMANTLWWKPLGSPLRLLAQGGAGATAVDGVPGGQWKSFTSQAIAANRGPIFCATLVPNLGGVKQATAKGVWACDFTGTPRLLFRTGIPDAVIFDKTLKSFSLLKASVGSAGVTRSFNQAAQLVWLATFTDGSQAIVVTDVP